MSIAPKKIGGGAFWLASYPKSGNTWFRVFLTNLMGEESDPADINDLNNAAIASARAKFDETVGFAASDLTADEIDRLRPEVYEAWARESDEPQFHKIHDAYTRLPDGRPLVSRAATKGVIYLLRNPLDIAVSFAHHSSCAIDQSIKNMGNEKFAFASKPDRLHRQLRQRLLSWTGHAQSWIDEPGLPVHVVRYEDMKDAPLETFSAAARFAGLPDDPKSISKAIRASDIRELKRQEQEKGFKEKSQKAKSFFRSGKSGGWRKDLTDAQVARIISDHREAMRRFGYLDDADNPVS